MDEPALTITLLLGLLDEPELELPLLTSTHILLQGSMLSDDWNDEIEPAYKNRYYTKNQKSTNIKTLKDQFTISWVLASMVLSDFLGETIIWGLEVGGFSPGVNDLTLFLDDKSWGFSFIASSKINLKDILSKFKNYAIILNMC